MIPLCALKLGKPLALLLCLFFLLLAFGQTCRAGETFVITGSELQQLSGIFQRLETLNEKLQSELIVSKENLTQLENELIACKADLVELQKLLAASGMELTQLRAQLQTAQELLEKAEKSFEAFRIEAESRIKALTRQRNIVAVLAIILALV